MMVDTQPKNGAILRTRTDVSGRDFQTVFRFIMRRKWIPVLGFLLGAGIAIGILELMPPLYSASARVMVDIKSDFEGTLQSEIEIIESTPVLSKVAGILGLYRDPRFNSETVFDQILPEKNEENALRERVLSRLDDMLDVHQVGGTSIIDMTIRHPNPERAAQIVNVVLSSYRERKMDDRFEQSRQMGDWMAKHVDALKAKADKSKKILEDFQSAHGLLGIGGLDIRTQKLQTLNEQSLSTQAELVMLQAQLEKIEKTGAGTRKSVDPALRAKETQLLNELETLGRRYGERHPIIVSLKAALEGVRARMNRKIADPRKGLEAEIAVAKEKLGVLQKQVDDIALGYDSDEKLKLQLAQLEADFSTNKRLYENLLIKHQDMMTQNELQDTSIKIVSMATIPSKPDNQARFRFLISLGFWGLFLGLLFVLVRALCNTGFTNVNQLESLTGYPVFAAIPNGAMRGVAIHHTIIEKPAAIMAESLRSLRVALRLRAGSGRGPRVVAFTSTLPDEGKTSLAVMLAMIAAKSGERVIIVDCDLRRPSLHKAFNIGNARGVQDYLSNNSGLDEAIYRKDSSGVHLLTAKAVPSYSLTLLTSGRMELMIESLREQYDLVILDAPSSLAFADARVLARMVDQTLYVVAWNRTRREGVLASLKAYADMGYEDLALVLNKVDLREYLRESASAVIYQYGHEQDGEASHMPA